MPESFTLLLFLTYGMSSLLCASLAVDTWPIGLAEVVISPGKGPFSYLVRSDLARFQ
jgi:hypothetical protein